MNRRRLLLVGAALVASLLPGVAVAATPDDVVASVPPDATSLWPGLGNSGQHLVCYAPGFTDWVVCVDYP